MTAIDRISPSRRPNRPVWGYQRWRKLLFMHWPVPIEAMRRAVPESFELDLCEGVAYVGIVAFAMVGVRPRFVPRACGLRIFGDECAHVRAAQWRAGRLFFSLEAASRLAVIAARAAFSLPYYCARMEMRESDGMTHYVTTRVGTGVRHEVRYRVGEYLGPSPPGTLEHFLLERYLLFTEKGGRARKGQVHHVPYPALRAEVIEMHDDLVSAAGLPAVAAPPLHVHYAPGLDVEVFALEGA